MKNWEKRVNGYSKLVCPKKIKNVFCTYFYQIGYYIMGKPWGGHNFLKSDALYTVQMETKKGKKGGKESGCQ